MAQSRKTAQCLLMYFAVALMLMNVTGCSELLDGEVEKEERTTDGSSESASGSEFYESDRSGISFRYPSDWKTVPTPENPAASTGEDPIDEVWLRAPDGQAEILVMSHQQPREIEESDLSVLKEALDGAYENLAVQAGGELDNRGEFEVGSLKGYEYFIESEDGYTTRTFVALEGNQSHTIQLEAADEQSQRRYSLALEEVLDSFEAPDSHKEQSAEIELERTEETTGAVKTEAEETMYEETSGDALTIAGPEGVRGQSLPQIMPDDFPLPAGATVDYASESETSFSLDLLIDSDYETLAAFFDEQLKEKGWEAKDHTEGEVEGSEVVETHWERGTFIPRSAPQDDSDYEQPEEKLTLTLGEAEPAGSGARIIWNDSKLANEKYGSES